ncbi:MAG: hypothetical protein AAFY28_16590, partial [Actinomycetota bacterium]
MTSGTEEDHVALPTRAINARLLLRLRALEREIHAVESEAASFDSDAALAQLRAKLDPLVDERRSQLAAELETARRAAAESVDAARRAGASVVLAPPLPNGPDRVGGDGSAADVALDASEPFSPPASTPLNGERAAVAAELSSPSASTPPNGTPVVESEPFSPPALVPSNGAHVTDVPEPPHPEHPAEDAAGADSEGPSDALVAPLPPPADGDNVEPVLLVDPALLVEEAVDIDTVDAEAVDIDTVDAEAVDVDTLDPPTTTLPAVREDTGGQVNVVIDAEAFGRAFAEVLKPVLEARDQRPQQPPFVPHYRMVQPEKRKSFWAHAWHADVLLALVAVVIVV